MSELRIIPVTFGGEHTTVTEYRIQHDWGQVYKFLDIDLPDVFEARFSNAPKGESVPQIGKDNMVEIPAQFFESGAPIYCYITLHDEETDGRTYYTVKTPISPSSDRTDVEPEEESIITQAITALNSAVTTTTQKAQEATESADRAEHAAEGVEGYAERAESAQQAAESARDRATQAETSARTSAATASEKASEAISSATTASQSALTAESASESAQEYATASAVSASASAVSASQASEHASTAGSKATEASGYASNANASAQTASQKALEAAQSASTATQAKTDAETAKTASETAQGLAESARDGAVTAKTSAEDARDEAQSIVDGITGKVEQIDSNTYRIESLEDDRYEPYPTDSVSGAVASFPDGADNIPLKSCIVQVEPVQDLHGYDSPWPAGGGKNKLEVTSTSATQNGVTITVNSDGTISLSGTATDQIIFSVGSVALSGKYILSGCPSGGSYSTYFLFCVSYDYGSGETVTFDGTSKSVQIYVRSGVNTNGLVFKPMIRLASDTDATYSPYSNICPISGWTGCEVQRTGKNLFYSGVDETNTLNGVTGTFDAKTQTISIVGTNTHSSPYILLNLECTGDIPREVALARALFNVPSGAYPNLVYRKNGVWFSVDNGSSVPSEIDTDTSVTLQIGIYGTATTINATDIKGQIELGSTATAYEPYSGQTYDITFPSEAGTVYGAYVDVINGELVVDRAQIASYNGETLPSTWISDRDVYASGTTPTIGAQVVYKLAEPIHYPITSNQINSLYGQNNIWANTGDTEVEYRADVTKYISKKITEAVSALT